MSPKTIKPILLSLAISGLLLYNWSDVSNTALAWGDNKETARENATPSACLLSEEDRATLPTDVRKYVELTNTCRHWGNDYTKDSVGAVGEHANFSTTNCYSLQIKYNRLKTKYKDKSNILDLVDSCYVSF